LHKTILKLAEMTSALHPEPNSVMHLLVDTVQVQPASLLREQRRTEAVHWWNCQRILLAGGSWTVSRYCQFTAQQWQVSDDLLHSVLLPSWIVGSSVYFCCGYV